mmetsp:Transcript_24759/g.36518  ORF Transcript_24759/g.36518 Transcript_24759/m.36518 type:complete len:121 (-) Transcript_24759:181-543(-)|eukprot:CAMPEP_0185018816 /NCGR_PEP_ID=MMETSP1103-20130426/1488_1 /TAXON_ID=36769 /ORGANISM="Paraphysomonas bandaiensis, Strain Caron Lab Isolate" /LENGTH=120 /DNA_ID=CAMNT_0027548809 /DNA_START=123 /DNA_END=485 /DNA_ORIENTATION=+
MSAEKRQRTSFEGNNDPVKSPVESSTDDDEFDQHSDMEASALGVIMNAYLTDSHGLAMDFCQKIQRCEELASEISYDAETLLEECVRKKDSLEDLQENAMSNCRQLSESIMKISSLNDAT